jgi:hypothetical protein
MIILSFSLADSMDGHVDGHGPGDTRRHHPRIALHQTAQPTLLPDSRQSLSRVNNFLKE